MATQTLRRRSGSASTQRSALFELEEDAERLGDTLGVRRGSGIPGYASHRWFEYTPIMFRKITNSLKG